MPFMVGIKCKNVYLGTTVKEADRLTSNRAPHIEAPKESINHSKMVASMVIRSDEFKAMC